MSRGIPSGSETETATVASSSSDTVPHARVPVARTRDRSASMVPSSSARPRGGSKYAELSCAPDRLPSAGALTMRLHRVVFAGRLAADRKGSFYDFLTRNGGLVIRVGAQNGTNLMDVHREQLEYDLESREKRSPSTTLSPSPPSTSPAMKRKTAPVESMSDSDEAKDDTAVEEEQVMSGARKKRSEGFGGGDTSMRLMKQRGGGGGTSHHVKTGRESSPPATAGAACSGCCACRFKVKKERKPRNLTSFGAGRKRQRTGQPMGASPPPIGSADVMAPTGAAGATAGTVPVGPVDPAASAAAAATEMGSS